MRPEDSFVGQPIRSLQTMLRVIAMDSGMLQNVIPDGIYGASTMQAVSDFQKFAGLPVTGITDQQTWDAIVLAYEPARIRVGEAQAIEVILDPGQILRSGESGPYIFLLQSMLIWLSQSDNPIPQPDHTGIFDQATKNSVFAFQALAGLPETGQVDKITWKHLSRHFTLDAHHNSKRNQRNITE